MKETSKNLGGRRRFSLMGNLRLFLIKKRERGKKMRLKEAIKRYMYLQHTYKNDIEWEKGIVLFQCLSIRDRETAEHSLDVANYSYLLAQKLGLDADRFFLAGLLHDIGKIDMDDSILKSQKKLNKFERLVLSEHVIQGTLLLSAMEFGEDIIEYCQRHHERLNGQGYPYALSADDVDISITARIAMIADQFSAMTNKRKYRDNNKVFSHQEALDIMFDEAEQGILDENILNELASILNIDIEQPKFA